MATPESAVTLCVEHNSSRDLEPDQVVRFGVAPFESHEGFRLYNMQDPATYQITLSDPVSTYPVSLGRGEFHIIPPYIAPASQDSFTLTVLNLTARGEVSLKVRERGYCYDVTLTGGVGSTGISVNLFRDTAVDGLEAETLFLRTTGQDSTSSGNDATLVMMASDDATTSVPVEDGRPEPGARTIISLWSSPNPFSSSTTIGYEINITSPVDLTLFDVTGRRVRILEAVASQPPGFYRRLWDGRDDRGQRVSAGVYYYQLRVGPQRESRSIIVLR